MDKPIFTLPINEIICGDTIEVLKTFPDESIDMVMTSPPYWALRDYGTAKWESRNPNCEHKPSNIVGYNAQVGNTKDGIGRQPYRDVCRKCGAKRIDQQIGLEPTFQEYITKLCNIFDEVKRVLKKTGTCWVNISDTYYGGGHGGWREFEEGNIEFKDPKYGRGRNDCPVKDWDYSQYQAKCMCLIPERFCIEMVNRGWIKRNSIIWHKPNSMPSSIKDRFTVDFEYVFFFVKNKKYWFETQYEPFTPDSDMAYRQTLRIGKQYKVKGPYEKNTPLCHKTGHRDWQQGMNKRSKDAVMQIHLDKGRNKRCVWTITTSPFKDAHFAVFPEALVETPIKAGCPKNGLVLDPFCGSGTTCLVAKKLNRNYIGIDLSPTYVEMAKKRILNECGGLF